MEILQFIEILCNLSKNRLYTKMLRIHLFSIFTIKTPWALVTLAPLGLLIDKTLYSNYNIFPNLITVRSLYPSF